MKTLIMALTTVATLAVGTTGMATDAEATGRNVGLGIAAGVIGGIIVGSALANRNRYNDDYGDGYGYDDYYGDEPLYRRDYTYPQTRRSRNYFYEVHPRHQVYPQNGPAGRMLIRPEHESK